MNTDIMHDETCLEMARVLGERGQGFMQLTLVSKIRSRREALRANSRGQRATDHV